MKPTPRLSAAAYYAMSAIMAPASVAGYALWVGRGLRAARRAGVSITAQGPLVARYFQHALGTRRDDAAAGLMTTIPGVPRLALELVVAPVVLAHRATGYVPRAFRYPFEGDVPPQYEASARTAFFDEVIARQVAILDQLVILGAGFDTRSLRHASRRVRCYEVDMPRTQAVKREALAAAGIDASGVAFVAADFEREDWLARLVEAGFDRARPAMFLWEGVTLYLDRAAVEATLRTVASIAKGSVIAFDYFTTTAMTSREPYWRYARATTRAAGEPMKLGIDDVADLVTGCGLSLIEHHPLGDPHPWGGFAVARS